MRVTYAAAVLAALLWASVTNAATPAQSRMNAARELQSTFDQSLVRDSSSSSSSAEAVATFSTSRDIPT